jgi:hypothetical protein
LCSRRAEVTARQSAVVLPAPTRVRGQARGQLSDPRRPRVRGLVSDTLAAVVDLSTLAVFLGSMALPAALTFRVRVRRSRDAAVKRVATLEARPEDQRSTGERRDGLLRTVVETTPVAVVLFGDARDLTFTNRSARDLSFEGMAGRRAELFIDDRAGAGIAAPGRPIGCGRALQSGRIGRTRDLSPSRRHLEDGQLLIAVRNVTQEINRHWLRSESGSTAPQSECTSCDQR